MLSKELVQAQEENIRNKVRGLPDEARLAFFSASELELKDPDTYATLNYIFIAGLHHFYLGKWRYGLVNITLFWAGIAIFFLYSAGLGAMLVVGVTLLELYEMFQAQLMVQHHNNGVMEAIYNDLVRVDSAGANDPVA